MTARNETGASAPRKYKARTEIIGDREVLVMREFDAPRRLVFEAFSKPEHLKRWWGPAIYEMTSAEMDFRSGGAYRYVTRAADGTEHPFKGVFREVISPERLVFTQIYDVKPFDAEVVVTMTLEERDGKTLLTSRSVFPSAGPLSEYADSGMEDGMNESYDRLDGILRNMMAIGTAGESSELAITRVFDAPRELVFEAWSDPEHFRKWFPPADLTMPVCEMDFRAGGAFRATMRTPDGIDFADDGVFREIVRPERIVWTWYLRHLKPNIEIQTAITFAEWGKKTQVTVRQTFLKSAPPPGVREGWTSTLEKLAALLPVIYSSES
jgi:uncharacterized protein YndB with AHSA1/START domain